jgi:tryptophan 2-monooxygenase
MKKIILAGNYWNGLTCSPSGYVEIAISDGKITEIGRRLTHKSGARIIDLTNHFVMPGFIDCHVHLTGNSKILSNIIGSNDADLTLAGVNACNKVLHNGFTTVRDAGDFSIVSWIVPSLKKAVDSGNIQGPRIICGGHMLSAVGGHFDFGGVTRNGIDIEQVSVVEGISGVRRGVHNEVRHGADWIKFAASGGFLSPSDGPEDVSYSAEEINAIVTAANDIGKPAFVHAYDNKSVYLAAMAGVRSVEHGSFASVQTLEMLEARDIYLVPTQYAVVFWARHDNSDDPEFVREKKRKYADTILKCAVNIARSNVKIAFGTDLGTFDYSTNGAVEFSEMRHNGITTLRALKAATSVAAELLQLNTGSIMVGKSADIIAMPGNPFDDIKATEKVNFVMKNGIVYRNS